MHKGVLLIGMCDAGVGGEHVAVVLGEYPPERNGATPCFNVRSCCWNFNRAPLGFLLVSVDGDGLAVREIETGAYA